MPALDYSEDATYVSNISRYAIIARNTKQFQLVEQYLDSGLSFHQVKNVVVDTKELLVIRSIGSCPKGIVSHYSNFIYAMNLECVMEILRKC